MPAKSPITRRGALKLGAAAAALPLVHVRTAGAAGKISVAFWDHWVPQGNAKMKEQVLAWAQKNAVEAQIDFVTSIGNKLQLTVAAESQAGTGHDMVALRSAFPLAIRPGLPEQPRGSPFFQERSGEEKA